MRRFAVLSRAGVVGLVVAVVLGAGPATVRGEDFERLPVNYRETEPDNVVSRLQKRIDAGKVDLKYDAEHGFLRSVLAELNVPLSSQVLVFTKTSLQRQRIAPKTPRALYFNDDVYIGFCQNGDVMEVSAVDPQLGTVFYTLTQKNPIEKPRFVRQYDSCLICHGASLTRGVPGHMVRSVYPDDGGYPILSAGTFRTDHTSPLKERWGGWYVTGTSAGQTHLGNCIVRDNERPEDIDNTAGSNVTNLRGRFKTSAYLTPHSDIVALMVMEHQAEAHNLITRANFQTRVALHDETQLNKELGKPAGHRWESTTSRIKSAAEPLVKYLLFSGEAKLTGAVRGTSGFAEEFAKKGPKDPQGRSLRDFDLERRMFRYPCSYLIYSPAFDAMPAEAKDYVYRRLWDVLNGKDPSPDFAHLSAADRKAILEILIATKPNLPDYWKKPKSRAPTATKNPNGPRGSYRAARSVYSGCSDRIDPRSAVRERTEGRTATQFAIPLKKTQRPTEACFSARAPEMRE